MILYVLSISFFTNKQLVQDVLASSKRALATMVQFCGYPITDFSQKNIFDNNENQGGSACIAFTYILHFLMLYYVILSSMLYEVH